MDESSRFSMLLFSVFYGQINRSKKAQDYDRQVNELTDTCKQRGWEVRSVFTENKHKSFDVKL